MSMKSVIMLIIDKVGSIQLPFSRLRAWGEMIFRWGNLSYPLFVTMRVKVSIVALQYKDNLPNEHIPFEENDLRGYRSRKNG
jgi:hypothetical protein